MFGIPGEETLDLNESLSRSSIDFIPVRHEQGGAYMADVYGRLTGHAGVCLGTLGPGALNLVTAVADAYLDRAPLVALTGQGDLERMHKESHQYIDLLRVMRPITKWNARALRPGDHPRGGAQGLQGGRDREAGLHAPRAARGRDGAGHRGRAAAAAQPGAPGAAGARAAPRGRDRARRHQPGGAGGQRRGAHAAPWRRCASSCGPPASPWRRRSWARACCRRTTPRRSDRWGSSRATTGWPASTRPTWCWPSATTSWSTRPSTGTRARTRRSSASTRCPPRSTSTSSPRWSWSATSTTCSPA